MKKSSIFFIFIVISLSANAQGWIEQSSGTSKDLYDVYFRNSSNGWVCGQNIVKYTTNSGSSWNTESDCSSSPTYYAIDFYGSRYGMITGSAGTVYYTDDYGSSWTLCTQPAFKTFQAVYMVGSDEAYVGATDGYVYKTEDGGNTWSEQGDAGGGIHDFYFYSSSSGYASSGHAFLETTNNGVSWSTEYSFGGAFYDISFDDSQDGWAVFDRKVYKTTNGGDDWNDQTVSLYDLNGIYFISSTIGWTCGENGKVYGTDDSGDNWDFAGIGIPTNADLNAIYFTSSSTGWVVGDGGKIYKTTCGGVNCNVTASADRTEVCEDDSEVDLSADSDAAISYEWNPGNYSGQDYNNVNVTSTTTYTVEVQCAMGKTADDDITITYHENPEVTANKADDEICEGESTQLSTDVSPSASYSYYWSPSSYLSNRNISDPDADPPSTRTYTVKVTNNSTGCFSESSVEVIVNENPRADAGSNHDICDGMEAILGDDPAATGGDGNYSYSWTPTTDLLNYNQAHPIATPSSNKTYTLRVTDGNGCWDEDDVDVDVIDISLNGQPSDVDICLGGDASFSISASGINLTYQWSESENNGITFFPMTGEDNATLSFTNADTSLDNNLYYCVVTDECGDNLQSNTVSLNLKFPPKIETEPISTEICDGTDALFSLNATGDNVSCQWQENIGVSWLNLSESSTYSGVNTSSLTVNGATAGFSGYQYRCIVSGDCSPVDTSSEVTLTISVPFAITEQPVDTACLLGDDLVVPLEVTAASSFQWQKDIGTGWQDVTDATFYQGSQSKNLIINDIEESLENNKYRCICMPLCDDNDTSDIFTLSIKRYPNITEQPIDFQLCNEADSSIKITAFGDITAYRWQVNEGAGWTNLSNDATYSGVATNQLGISNGNISMEGNLYRCIVEGEMTAPNDTSEEITIDRKSVV